MRRSSIAILGFIALGAFAGCGGGGEIKTAASARESDGTPRSSRTITVAESASQTTSNMAEKTMSDDGGQESSGSSAPAEAAPSPGLAARKASSAAPPPVRDQDRDAIPDREDKSETAPSGPVTKDAPHEASMLIYTAHVTMAVYQVEPGLASVEKIARELGGYLATRGDTEITVRIPRARFDEAIRRVGLTGDVLHKELSAEDVTDAFVDLEVRLKNAHNMRERLAELLKRADVKSALEIEKELGRITGDIEQMEGKLKVLRDRIAYSTITVTFQGRGAGALRDMPLRLPFPWLSELGLPRLLSLHE